MWQKTTTTAAAAVLVALGAHLLAIHPSFSHLPHPYENSTATSFSHFFLSRAISGSQPPLPIPSPLLENGITALKSSTRLFEGKIQGAESIVLVNDRLYMFDRYGYLHVADAMRDGVGRLRDARFVWDPSLPPRYVGPGRPLGCHPAPDGKSMIVCDSLKGLIRLRDLDDPQNKKGVEILSNVAHDTGEVVNYANDLDVARDGSVYFTSSTREAVGYDARSGCYDTLGSYVLNYLQGRAGGRLLLYRPDTGRTETLLDGIFYANGVALARDESFVLVVETSASRILKYHLVGEKKGTVEEFAGRLPGMPDGVSLSEDGESFWVSLLTGPSLLGWVARYPWVRSVLAYWMMPRLPWVADNMSGFTAILKLDGDSGEIVKAFVDVDGTNVKTISAVTEKEGVLFIGNLGGDYVSIVDA